VGMRILVIQTAFLGDIVLTLPLIDALRQRFPQSPIDVVTVPAHAPLLQGQPGVDTVIPYDKRGSQRGMRGLFRMMRTLRARGYHLVVSPHRSLRSAWLVACSGSTRRIGFRQWWTRWAYTDTVRRPHAAHEVARHLHLLTTLGSEPVPMPQRLTLQVAPAAREQVAQHFGRVGIAQDEVVVGIIPGSQWGTKRWPAARFAALIERLVATLQTRCILFGAPQDRAVAEAITAACRVPVLDFIGRTTLQELPAYVERCAVVVSNDTGPMHIAAALGKPIVALYGPTTAAMGFTPYGVPWEEVSVSLDCRPCHAHGPHRCPLSHWRCMLDLPVERVASRVQRLLQQASSAAETGHSPPPRRGCSSRLE
jgi:heptosyltransferase-2